MHGTAAGKYASQLLKAGDAAQPKGCSARFVPTIASTFPSDEIILKHIFLLLIPKNDTDATHFIGFETHPIVERSEKNPLLGRGFRGGMRI